MNSTSNIPLSEIRSVSSSNSQSSPKIPQSVQPSFKLFSELIRRASSNSPKESSRFKNTLLRRFSKSPSRFIQEMTFKKQGSMRTQENEEQEKISEELLQRKKTKNLETYVQKQKKAFQNEFHGFMEYRQALDSFIGGTSGLGFKALLDGVSRETRIKRATLKGCERSLLNLIDNGKEKDDNRQSFYLDLKMIQKNEAVALNFLKDLKENLTQLSDKATLQLISQEQLENIYANLKKEVSMKEQAYQDIKRLADLLQSQNNDFQSRVFPVKRTLQQIQMKASELGIDIVSDRFFQEEVLNKKQEISETRQAELRETILEFAETRKNVLAAKKRIKEQEAEIEELEHLLILRKSEKVKSGSLLNSLDYIDRIAYCFVYNAPDEFEPDSIRELDREVEKIDFPSNIKLERVGSNRSINSALSITNNKLRDKRTLLNVLSKIKKSPFEINNSQCSLFINRRQVFTDKNSKKAGIERIERFYSRHNGDISGLFEKILQVYRKLVMEDESLRTRIEDLSAEKGALFDVLNKKSKKLRAMFEDIPRENRDLMIKRFEYRARKEENAELNGNTLNQVRVNADDSEDYLKSLNVKDIKEFQAGNMRNLLFLKQVLLRFCGIVKAIFKIKEEHPEKDDKFMRFINELSGKSLKFIDFKENEDIQAQSPLKSPSKLRNRIKNPLEATRLPQFQRLIHQYFQGIYSPEACHLSDIITLDFVISSFTTISDFRCFLEEVRTKLLAFQFEDEAKSAFLGICGDELDVLKEHAQRNCLKKYCEFFEDLKSFFSCLQRKTSEQKGLIRALEKVENGLVASSMEELVLEIDERKPEPFENEPDTKALDEKKERGRIVQKRVEFLGNTALGFESGSTNLSTDFEESDEKYLERLGLLMKEALRKEAELKDFSPIQTETAEKPNKRAFERAYMQELEKNRSEIRELLSGCVHNNRKFSRILSAIVSAEKRSQIREFKNKLKQNSFWEKKDISQREILRKQHFLRPEEVKIARSEGFKGKKREEKVRIDLKTEVKKRPVTGFVRVNKRSLSPRDLGFAPRRDFTLIKEVYPGKGNIEGESSIEGKKLHTGVRMRTLRQMYLGYFERKKEGSV